jgi:hypothetical protein
MNVNLLISAVRNLSIALLLLSGLMFPGSGVPEFSPDPESVSLQRIVINNATFDLLGQTTLSDPGFGTNYRYRSSDSQTLDVFVFPIAKHRYALELPVLDQEVTNLLLVLDELKARKVRALKVAI